MSYSDLPQEKVDSIIEEINETKLVTDLVLMQQDMIHKGKVNNDAFRYLQSVINERLEESREKSGRK